MPADSLPGGGAFIAAVAEPGQMTPELLPSDARLMARAVADFVRGEVAPLRPRLEAHDYDAARALFRHSAEIGLLGAPLPERWGGFGLPKSTCALLTEQTAADLSFAIGVSVHTGVAALPIVLFGTDRQREERLPAMAAGERIGAFALSEPDSGSDALAASTRADAIHEGSYAVRGSKMWITNGGFADQFVVFAQVGGDQFTAMLVDRGDVGFTVGAEEHKMGLVASSTVRLQFDNARIPADRVVGEVGAGHRPALYALNVGRFNIAAISLGAMKEALRIATVYACERRQFARPLADFALVRSMLASMAASTYTVESMLYRVAGWLDAYGAEGDDGAMRASEEFAIEGALLKVYATEALATAVDSCLQVHGGFGFSEEFPAARYYRDARVFRIFEGANEINRISAADQLVRRIRSGRATIPSPPEADTHESALRRLLSFGLGSLVRDDGKPAQQDSALIANAAALLFGIESAAMRAEGLAGRPAAAAGYAVDLARATVPPFLASAEPTTVLHDVEDVLATAGSLRKPGIAEVRDALAQAVIEAGGAPW